MEKHPLKRIAIDDIAEPSVRLFDPEIEAVAKQAIDAIRAGKEPELRRWAERLDGLPVGAPLVISRDELKAAYDKLPKKTTELMERTKGRVAAFAAAQRACLTPLELPIRIEPIKMKSQMYSPEARRPPDPGEFIDPSDPNDSSEFSHPNEFSYPSEFIDPNDLNDLEDSNDSNRPTTLNIATGEMAAKRNTGRGEKGALVGRHGHDLVPVARVGCYVPGGAFPLPSSAIMTVVPAKVAGVEEVWCAGPRPSNETLAAAWVAGADGFLQVGGAHAIAALAFGICIPRCDIIVGPGGKYVMAAKRQLFGIVGTEAPAGPSELLIIADKTADPDMIAADLLAQAEHSPDAMPAAIVSEETIALEIEKSLMTRLEDLPEPNQSIAYRALSNGFLCVEQDLLRIVEGANRCAPEHLEIATSDPVGLMKQIKNAGSIFLGIGSAEVFGDYGAGPNHTLPTGGASRFAAGLSVLCFLRARTWLAIENPELLAEDTAAFARLEGLEAHAQAALARVHKHKNKGPDS
ncbi:MAG: histidinol dehydrogenase [Rectinema sp.]